MDVVEDSERDAVCGAALVRHEPMARLERRQACREIMVVQQWPM